LGPPTQSWMTLCRLAGSFWCSKGLYYLQNWALLRYYAANSDNFLPTFPNNLSVPSSGIKKQVTLDKTFLLSLQNSHGHAKEFLYRKYGHAPSKCFASPALDCWTQRIILMKQNNGTSSTTGFTYYIY